MHHSAILTRRVLTFPLLLQLLLPLLWITVWPLRAQNKAQAPAPSPSPSTPEAGAAAAPALHSIAEIRGLSRAQLADRPRVELEATVVAVLAGNPHNLQIIQDGIATHLSAARPNGGPFDPAWNEILAGDTVRVTGYAKSGNFAPVIVPEQLVKTGTVPLPEPLPVTVSELSSGRLTGQWITLSGVVRNIVKSPEREHWGLEVSNPSGEFVAQMYEAPPPSIIGSHVRIRGVCLIYQNIRGQFLGQILHAGNMANITITQPAEADPFAVPEISTDIMLPFNAALGTYPGRQRLRGTVIFSVPDSHFYLQANRRGVKILLAPGQTAVVGDEVEVAGFVRMRQGFAELANSLVRKLGTAPLPEPEVVRADTSLTSAFYTTNPPPPDVNARLVSLQGTLVKADKDLVGGQTLWIEAPGERPMNVPVTVPPDTIPPRVGSLVEVIGLCELVMPEPNPAGGLGTPLGLRIFMAHGSGLNVLQAASWWTPARLWMLVGGIALAYVLTLLQIRNLRHRIRVGAAELAEALVRRHSAEARIQERQRLSEEVHDIMAQSLTGVSLQLKAADMARTAAPDAVPRHLKLASGLLELARDEIRRTLQDLHSSLLENGDLTGALQSLGSMFTKSGACEVAWEIRGTPPHVHPLTAHSLLRVTQESLSNSMKHGQATRIDIRIDYTEKAVSLTIVDNGHGSSPGTRLGPQDGHFGLENMKGRMRRLGGDFKFSSVPGQGATVEAHIPVQPAPAAAKIS